MSAPTYAKGFARGLVAFAEGLTVVPALDEEVRRSLVGVASGDGVPYLSGWIAGWHHANLLAPVEEVSA